MANDTLSVSKGQIIEADGKLFRARKNLAGGFTSEDIRNFAAQAASPRAQGRDTILSFVGEAQEFGDFSDEAFTQRGGIAPNDFGRFRNRRVIDPQQTGELDTFAEQGTGAVQPTGQQAEDAGIRFLPDEGGTPVGELDPRFSSAPDASTAFEQGNLISFAGSPDVFDSATGQRLTAEEVEARGGFGEVEQRNQIRPGITNEEQFAQMAGQPLTQEELQALTQTGEGADQMAQESDLTAGQGADVPSQAPQAAQTGGTATGQGTGQETTDTGVGAALSNEDVFKEMNAQGFFDVKRRDTGERVSQKEFQEAGLNIDQISGRSQQEQGGVNFVKQINEQGFYDVFNAKTGERISQEEFQAQGLNIDHIPEMQTQTEENIKRVTGQDAVDYYNSLEQMVADRLGGDDLEDEVDEAQEAISDFFEDRKTASQILEEEFKERGIEKKTTLLNDLDEQIREQKNRLKDLPEDIQATLEDAGVTQSQLNRIITKESKQPTELLNELLEERNALASEINTAMGFAERFANTRLEDQATKLSALEFELNSAQGELTDLETEKKDIMNLALEERKSVLELALASPSAGIDTYEDSLEEAIKKATAVQKPQSFSVQNVGGFQILTDETGKVISTKQPSSGSGGGDDDIVEISTANKTKLLGVGLSLEDLANIENDVNQFGIRQVLINTDDANQREAIAKVYDALTILDEVEAELEPEDTSSPWWKFWE